MADPLERMVALEECKAVAAIRPGFAEMIAKLEEEVDEALAKQGFRDVSATRSSMQMAVARIVKAKKLALDQLSQLAYDEQFALGDD